MTFSLRHDVGIGDFINVESYWSFEEKAALRTIHQAFPDSDQAFAFRNLINACPTFGNVCFKPLKYPTERPEGTIPTLRDHAILHRKPFVGSAFLAQPLECRVPTHLPARFDVIVPSTPFGGDLVAERNVQAIEWYAILGHLTERDTLGLVLNAPGGPPVPTHPWLLDLTGRTSLPTAVEVLKRASGYIGIDSCLAILAAQLFAPDDLLIRTLNPHVFENPWLYYLPRDDYTFLVPRFGHSPYIAPPSLPEPGRIVELRCNARVGIRDYTDGDRVELEPSRADSLIAAGLAVELET